MKVTIEREIPESFATPEQLADMTDAEIVELLREDPFELLDGAKWTIEREEGERPDVAAKVPDTCPACAAKRLHLASEREQWHPAAGEGKSKEHGAA
jgi:ribosome-associated toxin RatA of RatAB toxin-antitoxin module